MTKQCEGCDKELGVIEALRWSVCMDCTKARHKATVNRGKCSCGRKRKEREATNGIRRWIVCNRCLGTVKQLPDNPIKYRRIG
jgi:hypothetical protein